MQALILNSGLGHRMGLLTSEHPKCMTEVNPTETILSRQLRLIAGAVNPVRLKNNPVGLDGDAIRAIYCAII